MKIKELIKIFEKLLPIYENAYNNNLNSYKLLESRLNFGLCSASYWLLDFDLYDTKIFTSYGYYGNYVKDNSLFPYPNDCKDLKPRIDFMKSEIKSLKRLQKRGFTHV